LSGFRSISLCGAPSDRACFDTAYVTGTAGRAGTLDPGLTGSFWRSAHEAAIACEWQKSVRRVLPEEGGATDTVLHGWLVGQGAAGLLQNDHPGSGEAAKRLAPLMARLKRSAQEIIDRRTVFLLPENDGALEHLARQAGTGTAELVAKLSEQLYQLLEHGQARYFTFVRVGTGGKGDGVLDRIIGYLHSRLTTGILDQAKIGREGPVLFVGPTGTGKSYGARLLAERMDKKYFPVNLSAVVETMLESRIRGYAPGAFTGASQKGSPGWFELANDGILFLDEFQSVPVEYQTQLLDLLHAVSDRVAVARIGDDARRETWNVKVVLAVNEDLGELLRSGRLRTDLFYRMRHLVHFPSLHARFSDGETGRLTLEILLRTYRWRISPVIAQATARAGDVRESGEDELTKARLRSMFPELDEGATARLLEHPWPGNLRELERVASDLFCDADSNEDPVIGRSQVDSALGWFAVPGAPVRSTAGGVTSVPRTLLEDVEDALRTNGFVIEHTIRSLKKSHPMHRLRSRQSLKLFLRRERDRLSGDVSSHPGLLRFIEDGTKRTATRRV
jgi:hypothetical protein